MNTIKNTEKPKGDSAPYQSVSLLKEAHISLIKRHREGDTNNFYDDVEEFLNCGSLTGALLDDYDEREASQSLLDYWVTVLTRAKRTAPEATLDEFDPKLSPVLDDALCPYLGLNAFQEKDKDLFYGRQRLINNLIGEIKKKRFLFVVGPSGSGKSSLVLGGAIPALQNGVLTGSEKWQYFSRILPGSNPLKGLTIALGRKQGGWEEIEKFKQDREHLRRLVEERSDQSAVLVIDQFEEIFTLCADEKIRDAFIENLIALVDAPNRKHTVIITLRTDYETHLAGVPALMPYYENGQIRVTPLTAADLREAIEEPAKRIGLKFESGIVDALVKDILGEPAGLPLLQFTLLQLWKKRENKRSRITWQNYRKLGDVRRALSLTAEEFYNSLPDEKKWTVKRILLRMARPSENLEVTSKRVKRSTLYKAAGATYRVDEVVEALVSEGLVRLTKGDQPENDQIEVAHEALVRNWGRLAEWLENERVNLRQRLRLTAAAEQWLEHNRDAGGLLGGKVLEEALQFDDLNELETEFIRASQAAVEEAEREKEAAALRERTLEQARILAVEQRAIEGAKNARWFRRFALALGVVALFAIAAAGWAFYNANRARASERDAREKLTKAEQASFRAEAERQKAEKQFNRAEEKRQEAETAQKDLKVALDKIKEESERAEVQRIEAEEQKKKAEDEQKKAQEQTIIAKKNLDKALENAKQLNLALKRVENLTEQLAKLQQQRLQMISTLLEADKQLGRNNPDEAVTLYKNLLDTFTIIEPNDIITKAEFRNLK